GVQTCALPISDPHPALFASYIESLQALAALPSKGDVEPVLRRFERAFAASLGYDFAWDQTTDTGDTVEAGGQYGYDPAQGIVSAYCADIRLGQLPGEALLALAADDLSNDAARKTAKRVMRVLVDFLLQGKPLHSRHLVSHPVSSSGRAPGIPERSVVCILTMSQRCGRRGAPRIRTRYKRR